MSNFSIVGHGVVGTTVGIALRKRQRRTHTVTDPNDTFSAHKGGVGIGEYQYLKGPTKGPLRDLDMRRLNHDCLRIWHGLESDPSWQGIVSRKSVTYFSKDPDLGDDNLRECLPEQNAERLTAAQLPEHLREAGFVLADRFDTSVFDTNKACQKLRNDYRQLGGSLEGRVVRSYDEVPGDGVIIDTTGLGRRMFLGDRRIWAKRGQTLILRGKHGLTEVLGAPGKVLSINLVPLDENTLLIGASKEVNDYNTEADVDTREALRRAAELIWPAVKNLTFVEDRVRFRPMYENVIVETHRWNGRKVIVVNGLGGGGWSNCFSLAEEVANLALAVAA